MGALDDKINEIKRNYEIRKQELGGKVPSAEKNWNENTIRGLEGQKLEMEIQGAKDSERAKITQGLISEDAEAGANFAKNSLGIDKLGRAKKVSQLKGVEKRFNDLSQGMGAEELQANRDKAKEEINRSTQLQNRRLQAIQSQQGVRGATAGSQQLSILQQGEQQKANFERDLFLQDRQARVEGLQNLAQVQKYNQEQMVERERFNLAQAAQEKYNVAQSALAFSGLGVQERSAERAKEAQLSAADAGSGCFPENTQILLEDMTTKNIQDLKIGDRVLGGGIIYNYIMAANGNDLYMYKGVAVSGSHAVNHDGSFVRVEDINNLDRVQNVSVVFNFSTKNHRIFVKGFNGEIIEFADFDESFNFDFSSEDRLKELNDG